MLIKSIELSNFRIFAGDHVVTFATDPVKNVTVIMGDNGSGKTTFAQAFSWCLYGTTTFKRNDDLLSFPARDALGHGQTASVRVCLTLIHNETEYRISRSQEYRKDSATKLHADSAVLRVSYKAKDGQEEFIEDEAAKKDIINTIIPNSISSYFFFDGERVEKMGNEIQNGRSKEFKVAVENLLGLSAISEAIRHLKTGGSTMVIPSYNKDYNANSDEEYQKAEREIQAAESRIAKLEADLAALEDDKQRADEARTKYRLDLEKCKEVKAWSEERERKLKGIEKAKKNKEAEAKALTNRFGSGAWRFFATPLMKSAISAIDSSEVEIKEAPAGVNSDTIRDLIERKTCLCGNHIEFNSKEYNALCSWLEIVPPEHLGAALSNFKRDCSIAVDGETSTLFEDVALHIGNIRRYDADSFADQQRVEQLGELIEKSADVTSIEKKYKAAVRQYEQAERDIEEKNLAKGMAEESRRKSLISRNSLSTNDETNKRVRRDRDYAEWIFEELNREHSRKETETREDLEREINAIFKEFFNGSLELDLDDRYNVNVKNKDLDLPGYDVETSEGQTVAVIFAFIAGVIRLATDSKRLEDEMLITEAYPLVMDAPMSKLDKKRISAICDVVPRIAEQTIIMIKDTDGELARDYLESRMGAEYAVVSLEPHRHSAIERVSE